MIIPYFMTIAKIEVEAEYNNKIKTDSENMVSSTGINSEKITAMWRQSNVVTIFKKGDKTLSANKRVVSLI